MSSIAQTAGVNQALLHYHFGSKELLYKSIFQKFMGDDSEKMMRLIINEIRSWGEPPPVELCAILYLVISMHTETHDNDIQKIISREIAEGKGLLKELVRDYIIPTLEQIEAIIERGITEGYFETSNPLLFVMNMVIFTADYVHAEDLLTGTSWHNRLYADKKDTLYTFMKEHTFKALRPKNKKLLIPSLKSEQIAAMDEFVNKVKKSQIAVI